MGSRLIAGVDRPGGLICRQPDETDLVIVSLDRYFGYRKLHHGYLAAQREAPVLATNSDLVCPSDGEDILDVGAWIVALEALLRPKIDAVLGKPSPARAEVAQNGREDPHPRRWSWEIGSRLMWLFGPRPE